MNGARWVEHSERWFELRMYYCDVCGRVIPRRSWRVEIAGTVRTFCDEACEALYRDYVLGSGRDVNPT